MSWLSVIKNNIINAVTHASPAPEQAAIHQKATDVASAIGELLNELENVARDVIDSAVATKFGAAAAVVEHDFLNAVIAVATARKAATLQPAPFSIHAPSAPVAPPQ